MNISLAGSGITYTPNDDELGRVNLEFAAFDGEVGIGQLPIPDPLAGITVATGRAAQVEEGTTRLTDGFIIDEDRVRGPMPAATAREYSFSVMDANALLGGFRVELARPAESDYARVIAFAALFGPSWDTTWVLNASTVTMPAKKYDTSGGFDELITDVVEFTGKTLFLHDLADGSGRCLHFHLLTNGHTCGLTISDVAGAEDRVTVFAPWNPIRQRTSVDLVNDVKGRDQSGRTFVATDATSITAHDADGLQHQGLVDFEATSQADLDVKTAAFLASQKDDQDTWTCAVGPLDEDALALIRVGDLITTTSSVMGLTASVRRIAHMTLTVLVGENGRARSGLWMAALELGAPVRRRARVKPSLGAVVIPPGTPGAGIPPSYDPGVVPPNDLDTVTLDFAIGGGTDTATLDCGVALDEFAILTVLLGGSGATLDAAPAGWSAHPANGLAAGTGRAYMFYKAGTGSPETVQVDWTPVSAVHATVDTLSGADTFRAWSSQSATGTTWSGGQIVAHPGAHSYVYVAGIVGALATESGTTDGTDNWGFAAGMVDVDPFSGESTHDWPAEWRQYENLGGTFTPSAAWAALSVLFSAGDAPLPWAGTPVVDELVGTGDGVTTTFTTSFAWLTGSLRVRVDGLDVQADITTFDPANRSFTLDFAPSATDSGGPAESVTADYVTA